MMNIFNIMTYFRRNKSAQIAKNRLHIIIAQEKSERDAPDYLPMLKQKILNIVAEYTQADISNVNVALHSEGKDSILEVNVTLPNRVVCAHGQ